MKSFSFSILMVAFLLVGQIAVASEKATFAAGCFWGVEEFFRKLPGVTTTKVGYAGGQEKNPTYDEVSEGKTGHAEALELQFEPEKISYEKLLDYFFKIHDPTTPNRQGNDIGPQYRSVIFFHSESQKKTAEDFKKKVEKSGAWKAPIVTEIKKAEIFYPAEEYHQKYLVKNPGGYDNHFLRNHDFNKLTSAK